MQLRRSTSTAFRFDLLFDCSFSFFTFPLPSLSLDPEQKEALIEVLAQLLKDAHNMVLGSAIAVFNESTKQ